MVSPRRMTRPSIRLSSSSSSSRSFGRRDLDLGEGEERGLVGEGEAGGERSTFLI